MADNKSNSEPHVYVFDYTSCILNIRLAAGGILNKQNLKKKNETQTSSTHTNIQNKQ